MSFPAESSEAPKFSLPNQDGETVSLADFIGKKNVVLYFYPKAMTPGCTTQACGIRDSITEFEALDTVVLGVSPDPVARLGKFIEKESLNFTLLGDEDHSTIEAYGCWALKKFMGKEYMGVLRVTFIIGKDGVVKKVFPKVKTKTHHDDVLAVLKTL